MDTAEFRFSGGKRFRFNHIRKDCRKDGEKLVKKIGTVISFVLVLAIIGGVLGIYIIDKVKDKEKEDLYQSEIAHNSLTGNGVFVKIEEDATLEDVASALVKASAIKYKDEFIKIAKEADITEGFVAGTYRILPNVSYQEMAKQITRKSDKAIIRFTIPEGFEIKNIAERLEGLGLVNSETFYQVVNEGEFDYDFLKDLPERDMRLEGYLFPDTYEVKVNAGEKFIVNMMLARFDEVFSDTYRQRAKELGYSIDDIVTMASMVEREAASAEEMPTVAGVFYNRLKKDMKLESCASVQYILKERKTVLSTADTKIKSPYNTYLNSGLPVGPISSPGKASLEAALYPEDTEYMYFVLGKDGKHIFSKTYEEHLAAIKSNG